MKTLSFKNPWGYLVAAGIKDIENRTWKLPEKYKGQRVLIHVSAKPVPMKHESDVFTYNQWWRALTYDQRLLIESNSLPNSAIIGSVEIVDCVINHPSIWAEHEARVYSKKQDKEIIVPVWNWVLANPVLFAKPILNVKGKLSFWEYPNILAEPEEKDGELFCHCQLPIDEKEQVIGDSRFGYHCRYCGGKWYK